MATRKHTNPRETDLQPELRDILLRNGMQAHIVQTGDGYRLAVQGHDSPLLQYELSREQLQALTDWGTNSANRKAYNTFTAIISDDFDMPRDFVHARNANGRVAMGLHGYRIGTGEYGRTGIYGMPSPFLGWTPRRQDGYHLRRVGGRLFYAGAPMVAEREDGRMKPGELQSGGYGFYYKGGRRTPDDTQSVSRDVLQDLQAVITPLTVRPRSDEPARPYKDLISSPVYFTGEKWLECLSSHGVIVDKDERALVIQSEKVEADMVYDLTEDELEALASNSLADYPIERRLEVMNGVIGADFADKITLDMLNGQERIDLSLHPEVEQELALRRQEESQMPVSLGIGNNPDVATHSTVQAIIQPEGDDRGQTQQEGAVTDGRDLSSLKGEKGWYGGGRQGNEVEVGSISVQPSEVEGKYKMTAVINGETVTHEISQRQYDRFLAVDDFHRMKLFSKIFNEVDMKTRPETRGNLGMKIFAALTAGTALLSEVAHDLHRPGPEIYAERMGNAPRPYFKPGVDSPMDVAARNFEAQLNREAGEIRRGI
ncbi:MAG: hypothetical protein LUC18_03500 [Porphyromonadaceae bacterium]|nr:hypothetical protein [Porphyromonadaceae bacterium]